MSDLAQFPNTFANRRILPTLTGYIVTKFEPAKKYREEEEIADETGTMVCINGVDLTYEFEIEMLVKTGSSTPDPLTELTFTAPTATNAVPIPGTVSTTIKVVVRGEVKQMGDAGKLAKIGFKGWSNSNIPAS